MPHHLNDITVFIISSGEDTTEECKEALANQDCTFTIKHIKDTFPMSRAFQRMPDECDTKYFVQVDSDMILKPYAVQALYNGVRKSLANTYMVFGQLYEEEIGDSGAVKCWKSWLFKYFKFRDFRTVDRDIYRRTRWFGLRYKDLRQTLGLHHSRQTLFTKYLKTKSDIEKRRFLKISPHKHDMKILNNSIEGLPESSNMLLGALLGVLTTNERLIRSKNMELENNRYRELLNFLGIEGDSAVVSDLNVKTEHLAKLFYKSYRDSNSDHNDKTKLAIADAVIKIFGRTSKANPPELIRILAK